MAAANYLPDVLETTEAERLATGFKFTEGPLWHPAGHWYFVDLRNNRLHRLTPGKPVEIVTNTVGGNGTTFDLQGRLLICEGDARRVSRLTGEGKLEPFAERYSGGRFNRPNDIVCRSDGSIFFTDPEKRVPLRTARSRARREPRISGTAPPSTASRPTARSPWWQICDTPTASRSRRTRKRSTWPTPAPRNTSTRSRSTPPARARAGASSPT